MLKEIWQYNGEYGNIMAKLSQIFQNVLSEMHDLVTI